MASIKIIFSQKCSIDIKVCIILMSKELPCGGDITTNFLVLRIETSLEQNMEHYCGENNITTLENMADAHPLDIFPLSQYKRKDRNNMEIENVGTKLCKLNTNVYDKI